LVHRRQAIHCQQPKSKKKDFRAREKEFRVIEETPVDLPYRKMFVLLEN